MYGQLIRGNDGKITNPKSKYQPGEAVKSLTEDVMNCYEKGEGVLSNSYLEYNGRSFVDQANECQRTWLNIPDAPYIGDDEWRWNGVRPITRNRVISTAARLTVQLLYPRSFAQNDGQEEDRDASYAMDTMIEHNIRNSNYETAFLFGVISGLVNPINYFSVNYVESMQETWNQGRREQVLDQVFSGFQNSLIPIDEMLFGNAYVYEWQAQDWLINKKRVSYEEMEARFGRHENWEHVQVGNVPMIGDDGFYYDSNDSDNDGMVGYVNYKHRRSDCEINLVNNIYLSNSNTEYNPFTHRRYRTERGKTIEVPMYDTVKYGHEPIDAMRFIGYKSLADKMSGDQDAADREWQDFFDSSRLATFQPLVTMGADNKIDKSVVRPSGVTEIGKEAKAVPLNVVSPMAALNALREAERSANETSTDPQAAGVKEGPQKTKGEVDVLEENIDTNLSLTAKFIARMVKEVGQLMADDVVHYQTVGEAGELVGEMLYKTFVVDGRIRGGKSKTTYIRFTDKNAGVSMTPEEKDKASYKLLEEAGDDKELIEANPAVFVRLNWLIFADADQLMKRGGSYEIRLKLQAYDKAMLNPLVQRDPEAQLKITRDFLFEPLMKAEASKYLPSIQKVAQSVIPGANGFPQDPKAAPQQIPKPLNAMVS